MIMYRFSFYRKVTVQAIDVISQTEKQVVISEVLRFGKLKKRREAKHSPDHRWFDDWESAREFALSSAQKQVENLKARLSEANGNLTMIERMKQPEVTI